MTTSNQVNLEILKSRRIGDYGHWRDGSGVTCTGVVIPAEELDALIEEVTTARAHQCATPSTEEA